MLGDLRKHRLEATALVTAGVKDDAIDAQPVGRPQIPGQGALRPGAEGGIVTGEVDQVNGMEVEGRVARHARRLAETLHPFVVELWRPPESGRGGVDLNRRCADRGSSLEGKLEAPGGVDVRSQDWHG